MLRRIANVALLTFAMLPSALNAQTLARYEYWFDDDAAKPTVVKSADETIDLKLDISDLAPGLHFYNFRAVNSDGAYSPLVRSMFFVPYAKENEESELAAYEYWFDGDVANPKVVKLSGENVELILDVSGLDAGLHFYSFRAINSKGMYSPLVRSMFFVPYAQQEIDESLAAYEYWFDNDLDRVVTVKADAENPEFAVSLNVSDFEQGIHFFNFRAINAIGVRSDFKRHMFYVPSYEKEVERHLANYEYWIDDDFAHRTIVNVKSDNYESFLQLDVSDWSEGLHTFNFRAMNDDGSYSALLQQMVYIPRDVEKEESEIVAYRCTFNNVTQSYSLAVCESYENEALVISTPDILDVSTITANSNFAVAPDAATLTRSTNVDVSLQFQNKSGGWSTPEFSAYTEDDVVERSYTPTYLEKVQTLTKVKQGDFHAVSFTVKDAGSYFISASEDCEVLLFNGNGQKLVSASASALKDAYNINLTAGTYYALIYNMVRNEANPNDYVNLRVSKYDVPVTPTILGDVNQDGNINVTDAAAIVSIILGDTNDLLSLIAADVNKDGDINVTDEAAVVNIILADEGAKQSRRRVRAMDSNVFEVVDIHKDGYDYEITLRIKDSDDFIGAQFDIMGMPDAIVGDYEAADRRHYAVSATCKDGSERFVVLSNSNDTFRNGNVVKLILHSIGSLDELEIKNIVLVRPGLSDVFAAMQTLVLGTTTQIEGTEATADDGEVFDISGRRVSKYAKGIVIRNGNKVIVK